MHGQQNKNNMCGDAVYELFLVRVRIGTKASSCFKFNFIVMYDNVTDNV